MRDYVWTDKELRSKFRIQKFGSHEDMYQWSIRSKQGTREVQSLFDIDANACPLQDLAHLLSDAHEPEHNLLGFHVYTLYTPFLLNTACHFPEGPISVQVVINRKKIFDNFDCRIRTFLNQNH